MLTKLAPSIAIARMPFMTSCIANVAGIPNTRVTRCGYTGEDGKAVLYVRYLYDALY